MEHRFSSITERTRARALPRDFHSPASSEAIGVSLVLNKEGQQGVEWEVEGGESGMAAMAARPPPSLSSVASSRCFSSACRRGAAVPFPACTSTGAVSPSFLRASFSSSACSGSGAKDGGRGTFLIGLAHTAVEAATEEEKGRAIGGCSAERESRGSGAVGDPMAHIH